MNKPADTTKNNVYEHQAPTKPSEVQKPQYEHQRSWSSVADMGAKGHTTLSGSVWNKIKQIFHSTTINDQKQFVSSAQRQILNIIFYPFIIFCCLPKMLYLKYLNVLRFV